MKAIIPHHCGIHTHCKHGKWCKFLKVQNEHPDWQEDRISELAVELSNRPFGGKNMILSDDGIAILNLKICGRFNEKSIDKIAGGGCSNLSENFWEYEYQV